MHNKSVNYIKFNETISPVKLFGTSLNRSSGINSGQLKWQTLEWLKQNIHLILPLPLGKVYAIYIYSLEKVAYYNSPFKSTLMFTLKLTFKLTF